MLLTQIRNKLRKSLPKAWLISLRDWRDRLLDVPGYFRERRKFGSNSIAIDVLETLRSFFWPVRTILFYPQRPLPLHRAAETKLCALLGYAMTANPSRHFDAAFKRRGLTLFDPEILKFVPVSMDLIINARSVDISKTAVARAVAEVFGYPLEVDPTEYHGRIVEKSDKNGAHDGRVLQGPIAPDRIRPGVVYQKEIDNTVGDGSDVVDHRVVIYGDEIPCIFLKYRPLDIRFMNKSPRVALALAEDVFSPDEMEKLIRVARALGIDFGEFDVLRDKDKRIYVVDANHKPVSPPSHISDADGRLAFARMSKSFARLIEKWTI